MRFKDDTIFDVSRPQVTLAEEAHEIPKGGEKTGGCEWSISAHVFGDDGKPYWLDVSILGYPGLDVMQGDVGSSDMTMLSLRTEADLGEVVQSRQTIYKIAKFPNSMPLTFRNYPLGTRKITQTDKQVTVELGISKFVCQDDMTWHFTMEDKECGIKCDLTHTVTGHPMWYYDRREDGVEVLRRYTLNSFGGGYFWSGLVEGSITFGGKTVKVKGKGARQRYYALTYSQDEVGGWHDWNWFHFDEAHGCVEEMKSSNYKVMSLYLEGEKLYFPNGKFDIEHQDWALHTGMGVLIPTRYKVTMETEAGVLVMTGDVVGSRVWAAQKVPDCPFAMLDWQNVQGTFTYKDGRKKTLTNGIGGNMIRLWRSYPSPFLPGADELK